MAYQSSGAAAAIGSMLANIPTSYRADRDRRDKQISEAAKNFGTVAGQVQAYNKRQRLIYAGDENLEELKARKSEIEARIKAIDTEIEELKQQKADYALDYKSTPTTYSYDHSQGHGPSEEEVSSLSQFNGL